MSRTCPDTIELPRAIEGRGGSLADSLGVEPHAPAAAEYAVVAFDKRGEPGPRRLIERLDRVRRLGHQSEPTQVPAPPDGLEGFRHIVAG